MAILESRTIRKIFDGIAVRYDFLNTLLSFSMDASWRQKTCELVFEGTPKRLLDLGTGTGKLIRPFLKKQKWDMIAGLDFSLNMMRIGQARPLPEVQWIQGDFGKLPFKQGCFDLVVSAFTLRSVADLEVFFREVRGLLGGGGKAAFLCLTRPQSLWMKLFYLPYMRLYLPLAGKLFANSKEAYQFLSDSVLRFQDPSKTVDMMKQAGFSKVQTKQFSGGLATLFIGWR
jgi:demethylmenaquinone methyltransferase/2-methoxy-6-polyprenyl-1,4-benzoquinol methylase